MNEHDTPKTESSSATLVPINELIAIHEGLPFTLDQLKLADFTMLSRDVTLMVEADDKSKWLLKKEGNRLRIEIVYDARNMALAELYGATNVAFMLLNSSLYYPNDPEQAAKVPKIVDCWLRHPHTPRWSIELPCDATGAQVMAAAAASSKFVIETAAYFLMRRAQDAEKEKNAQLETRGDVE